MSNIGHRLRSGTHAVGSITASYEVRDFPRQSDQPLNVWWLINTNESTSPERRKRTALSGKVSEDGGYSWVWMFDIMTFGQTDYLLDTFFASDVQSAEVSVMTYTPRDVAVYLNATLNQPDWASLRKYDKGFIKVPLRFSFGTIIT